MIYRRNFLIGLFAGIAAPAIVRAESLMPVRGIIMPPALVQMRHAVMKPTCSICHGSFGMCSHTGGPMNLDDMRLDPRVVENLRIDQHDYSLMRKLYH